jgi:arylsulfatase A-like enzyme
MREMNHAIRRVFLAAAVAVLLCQEASPADPPATKPNVLFLLADDLGWKDLGCYGSTLCETPHLDRLCAEGAKFTQAYSAGSNCAPTRASIMTGKSPSRAGVWDNGYRYPVADCSLAEAMAEAGYQTFLVGKWNGGPDDVAAEGFSIALVTEGSSGKAPPERLKSSKAQDVADAAADALRKDRDPNRPFFLYVAFHEPRTMHAPPDVLERFRKKVAAMPPIPPDRRLRPFPRSENNPALTVQDNPRFAATVFGLDAAVGRLLTALEELELADNTIVVFFSDNGGMAQRGHAPNILPSTSVLPLAGCKAWLYEGGIRVPLIVRWPGAVKAGTACDVPVISTDFYPTFLSAAGAPPKPLQHVDGCDLVPLLRDGRAPAREALYWHFLGTSAGPKGADGIPYYFIPPHAAVRHGNLKLLYWLSDQAVSLYDLEQDVGETRDLSRDRPADRDRLQAMLDAWMRSLPLNKIPRKK